MAIDNGKECTRCGKFVMGGASMMKLHMASHSGKQAD